MSVLRSPAGVILIVLFSLSVLGCGKKSETVTPPPPEVIVSNPLKKEVTKFVNQN